MTNSGSNSEGSGPFPVDADLPALSLSLDLFGRFEGEIFRELDRLGADPGRDGEDVPEARCLACSSAIRASRAPLMRFAAISSAVEIGQI